MKSMHPSPNTTLKQNPTPLIQKLLPPYERYTNAMLRSECYARSLSISGKNSVTTKAGFVKLLYDSDRIPVKSHISMPTGTVKMNTHAAQKETFAPPPQLNNYPNSRPPMTTVHNPNTSSSNATRAKRACRFRLINVLLTPNYINRWDIIQQSIHSHSASDIWNQIQKSYSEKSYSHDHLVFEDAEFRQVNPASIILHSATKLKQIWIDILTNFRRTMAQYQKYGMTKPFSEHCGARLEVYYLFKVLEKRTNLMRCVMEEKARKSGIQRMEHSQIQNPNQIKAQNQLHTQSLNQIWNQRQTQNQMRTPTQQMQTQSQPQNQMQTPNQNHMPPQSQFQNQIQTQKHIQSQNQTKKDIQTPHKSHTPMIQNQDQKHNESHSLTQRQYHPQKNSNPKQNTEMYKLPPPPPRPTQTNITLLKDTNSKPKQASSENLPQRPQAINRSVHNKENTEPNAHLQQMRSPQSLFHPNIRSENISNTDKEFNDTLEVKQSQRKSFDEPLTNENTCNSTDPIVSKDEAVESLSGSSMDTVVSLQALLAQAPESDDCSTQSTQQIQQKEHFEENAFVLSDTNDSISPIKRKRSNTSSHLELDIPRSSKRMQATRTVCTKTTTQHSIMATADEWDIIEERIRKVNQSIFQCQERLSTAVPLQKEYHQDLESDIAFYATIKQQLKQQMLLFMR